jgi:hypothetical protein
MTTRDELWRKVYLASREIYTEIPGYHDHDARLTADAAAAGWFHRPSLLSSYRPRRYSGLARMPKPGNLLELGDFLEVEYVTSAGQIRGIRFQLSDHVPLYWSHTRQALFMLPTLKEGPCDMPPTRTENHLAQVWAKGRPAACSAKFSPPRQLPMPAVYPAIQISYHSDKFTHGKSIQYIHHFGSGVLCYFSHDPFGSNRAPDVMIRGGRLRLTTHGIDG